MDKEELAIINTNKKAFDLVQSQDWKWVKERLEEKLKLVTNLEALPDDYTKEDVEERRKSVALIREWINEIEGEANQHKSNEETPNKVEDQLIARY